MYYKLTKEEYKKNESEFKKTYIGNNLFKKWLVSYIVFIVLILELLLRIMLNYIDGNEFNVDAMDYFYIISILLIGIASIIYQIDYRKELKDYINTKSIK